MAFCRGEDSTESEARAEEAIPAPTIPAAAVATIPAELPRNWRRVEPAEWASASPVVLFLESVLGLGLMEILLLVGVALSLPFPDNSAVTQVVSLAREQCFL